MTTTRTELGTMQELDYRGLYGRTSLVVPEDHVRILIEKGWAYSTGPAMASVIRLTDAGKAALVKMLYPEGTKESAR